MAPGLAAGYSESPVLLLDSPLRLRRPLGHVHRPRRFSVRETAHQATSAPARTPIPAVASLTVNPERLERMWALSPAERIAAAQRGQFTLGEMLRWAARRRQEVPLVDGEFFFITAFLADAVEGFDRRWTPSGMSGHREDTSRDSWTIRPERKCPVSVGGAGWVGVCSAWRVTPVAVSPAGATERARRRRSARDPRRATEWG
jgi:hypothetical protein